MGEAGGRGGERAHFVAWKETVSESAVGGGGTKREKGEIQKWAGPRDGRMGVASVAPPLPRSSLHGTEVNRTRADFSLPGISFSVANVHVHHRFRGRQGLPWIE